MSSSAWPIRAQGGLIDWWTAVERCNLEPFRTALQADPGLVDVVFEAPGRTALMVAATACPALVELLLKAGADPNRCDGQGRPVWDYAPTWGPGAPEIWDLLLAAGLDPNVPAPDGANALHRISAGYCDPATKPERRDSRRAIVEALLRAGADPARRDGYGATPYELAQRAGNAMLLGLLKPPKGRTP